MRNIDIDVGINHGGGQLIQFVQNAETTHFPLFWHFKHTVIYLSLVLAGQLSVRVNSTVKKT